MFPWVDFSFFFVRHQSRIDPKMVKFGYVLKLLNGYWLHSRQQRRTCDILYKFPGGIQIKRRHEYTSTVYRIVVGVSCIEEERENTFGMEHWLQAKSFRSINTENFPCTHTADKSITVKPVTSLLRLVCLLCTNISSVLLPNHRFTLKYNVTSG